MCQQSWICRFCTKAFKRSDVLRRHYTRCPQRGDQPIPCKLHTGRRRRACNECVKVKLACDADFPCETCLSRGATCSGVSNSSDTSDHLHGTHHNQLAQRSQFQFLLKYVDPRSTSLKSAFGIQILPGAHHVDELQMQLPQCNDSIGVFEQQLLAAQDCLGEHDGLLTAELYSKEEQTLGFESILILDQIFESPNVQTQTKTPPGLRPSWSSLIERPFFSIMESYEDLGHAIIDELTHFTTCLPKTDMATAPNKDIAKGCLLFLSGKNHHFVDTYFERWHHHTPIIHRPSFSIFKAPLPLLLAVLLTGALFSPESEDVSRATRLLNLAERYIFDHANFRNLLYTTEAEDIRWHTDSLCAIQAAFQIAQIQLHSSCPLQREKVRHERVGQLITAARNLELHKLSHSSHAKPFSHDGFEWNQFGVVEAGIRLMCGIFHLESSFNIFYDTIPRVLVQEMCLDAPCVDDAYTATNSEDCARVMAYKSKTSTLKVAETVEVLLQVNDDEARSVASSFEFLHLFTIILGLLQAMWLIPHTRLNNESSARFSRGLLRWKLAWDHQISTSCPHKLGKVGFFKDAAIEFWCLASFLVSRGSTRVSSIMSASMVGTASTHEKTKSFYDTLKRISDSC